MAAPGGLARFQGQAESWRRGWAMNVSMMQPTFLPWQGLFELIGKSDIFIFLDDFEFSVQSFHQRNRLFADAGRVDWYTAHVLKGVSFNAPLNRTLLNEQPPWRKKLWKRLVQNYAKAPFFKALAPQVEAWLLHPAESLATQNIAFILQVCELLDLHPEFRFSSQAGLASTRSQRVAELLAWTRAKGYYCARGSFGYMKIDGVFPLKDVPVSFQDFHCRPYPQIGSPDLFVPYLSILDALFNLGAAATRDLVLSGTSTWKTWQDMENLGDLPLAEALGPLA